MAFIAAGVFAFGAASSYWWWPFATTPEVPSAPALDAVLEVPVVIEKRQVVRQVASTPPDLIDELKIALAKRRLRQAPGTC